MHRGLFRYDVTACQTKVSVQRGKGLVSERKCNAVSQFKFAKAERSSTVNINKLCRFWKESMDSWRN